MSTLQSNMTERSENTSNSEKTPSAVVRGTIDASFIELTIKFFKIFLAFLLVYFMGYYNFSIAWILVALIIYILREKYRREKHFKLGIAKAASANEKASILARVEDLPSWVYFPDTERAEWVNKIFHQLWPHVGHYVKDFIRQNIEPTMQDTVKKTTKFGSFRFDRIDLGEIPLRVGGIKVYREHISRHEIIMDLEIFYAGDCDLQIVISKLKAGIKDLQLHGTLRVVCKPLIDEMPLVGGIQLFFLNTPVIDFNLTNIADVFDIPGISDMLRKIVGDQIACLMVLPNKLTVKLNENVPSKILRFNEPAGVVRINVIEARDLMKKDVGMLGLGKSDPYCIITVGAQEFKTKVINNTVNPTWDFYCEALIEQVEGQCIGVELYDKDQGNQDDHLGRLTLDIQTVASKGQTDTWIPLEEAKSGQVHLKIFWLGLSSDALDLNIQQQELTTLKELGLSTAILLVYVDSAKGLPTVSKTPIEPHPYVKLSVGSQKFETVTQKSTVDPVWEQSFSFHVVNPEVQDLSIEILDMKSAKTLGNMSYTIGRLLQIENLEVTQPFSLRSSGPQSKLHLTLRLRILKSGLTVPLDIRSESINSDSPRSRSESESRAQSSRSSPGFASQSLMDPSSPMAESVSSIVKAAVLGSVDISQPESLRKRNVESPPAENTSHGLGQIQLTLRYSQQRNRLVIVVHKVIDLPQPDVHDPPDPYVKLYLHPDRNRDSKRKSQVIRNTCNPVYDETFDYVMSQTDLNSCQLLVTVNNRSSSVFSKSAVIGQIAVDLPLLDLSKAITSWYHLEPEITNPTP